MANIPISVFYNEDLSRDFTLSVRQPAFATVARPTLDQIQPMLIAGATFECDATFGSRSVAIAVDVVDPATSRINLSLPRAQLKSVKGQTGSYALLMTQNGVTRRLWGGPIAVTA